MNIQPSETSDREIQIYCYPTDYSELLPYFGMSIDYANLRCGTVTSRTKVNAYGLFWTFANKKCRILLAFTDNETKKRYAKYLKNMLTLFRSQHEFQNGQNEIIEEVIGDQQSSGSNSEFDSEMSEPSVEIMRVSDESGALQEVTLRPKSEKIRRFPRPLAVISGFFNFNRANDGEKSLPLSPRREKIEQIVQLFKKKRELENDLPTFQHFQEPLNMDRCSDVMRGSFRSLEWYDLNQQEMEVFEGRVTNILNCLNSNEKVTEADIESMCNLDFLRRLTISSNILWSHNLSSTCLDNDNSSEINLIGANLHKEQLRSEIFIEDDTLSTSIASLDTNGYAIVPPIPCKNPLERSVVIDDITKEFDFATRSANRLSFGMGDGEDVEVSPFQRFQYKPRYSKSTPSNQTVVNDETVFEICSNESTIATPKKPKSLTKALRKMIKPSRLINKLLPNGTPTKMAINDPARTPMSMNKTSTPESKCTLKKYRKTPFKRNFMNRLSFIDNRNNSVAPADRSDEQFERSFVQNFIGSGDSNKFTNFENKQLQPNCFRTVPIAEKEKNQSIVKRIRKALALRI